MLKRRQVIFALSFLTIASVASGDGGGPLLLVINFYLFSLGQLWIIGAEYFYATRRVTGVSKKRLLIWVVVTNLVSTAVGAIIIPFLWALLFMLLSWSASPNQLTLSGIFAAVGTWIVGDNSPFVGVAMASSALLFVATYFVTVWLEHRTFQIQFARAGLPTPADLRRTVIVMNLISYTGLVILFSAGAFMEWGFPS